MRPFRDRHHAGALLAEEVAAGGPANPVVFGLPRGGVPVAARVAERLGAPLDVVVARKVGVPHHPELGMGAIAESGVTEINDEIVAGVGVPPEVVAQLVSRERAEMTRAVERYRGGRPPEPVAGRTALVVDDGLATGYTVLAAVETMRRWKAATTWVAVPVGPPDVVRRLAGAADRVVCLETPERFRAVGAWYRRFDQVSDEEVVEALGRGRTGRAE